MANEPLGILLDILAALAVMFIFPVLICSSLRERIAYSNAERLSIDFAEDICSRGYIDEQRYEAYIYSLGAIGVSKNVELICHRDIYEPIYANGVFTGEIKEYEEAAGTEEILESMALNGVYECEFGDRVEVVIYDGKVCCVFGNGVVKGIGG